MSREFDWKRHEMGVSARMDGESVQKWKDAERAGDEPEDPRRTEMVEKFVRLYQELLPAREFCGGARGYLSGYYRLCAYIYRVSPAIFEGRTGAQMAKMLGISLPAWKMHIRHVDRMLSARNPAHETTGPSSPR